VTPISVWLRGCEEPYYYVFGEGMVYCGISLRDFFQLFIRVTPPGYYPSDRKVGNLLPACD